MTTRIVVTLLILAGLAGCGGGASSAGTGGASGGVTLQSVAVTPANLTMGTGGIQGYTATGTYSDGSTQDLTATASWTSGSTSTATVGASTGVATAVAAGATSITAAVTGKTANANLTVSATAAKRLSSIAVTPGSVSINTAATQQLIATATYSDNSTADLTSSVTWTTANSGVATVSSAGLVTAVTAGNGVVVTASLGAASGKSTVTVTTPTGALTGLSIPVAPFIYTGQAWDPTTWADAAFANGTGQHPYSYATWTVTACSPANAAWVDVNGWIYGNVAGTCTITAHSGALNSAPSTLTIADPALVTIVVTPATLSVAAGSSIQLSAVGTFSDGSQRDITSTATWASPTPGVATVGTTGAGTPGLVTGVAAGSVSIAASGITKTLPLTKTFAYSAVIVPASAPVQSTVTQPVVWDNTASISSLNSSWQKTTYSVNAFHTNSIAVGCNWFLMYDPIAGMNIQNLNCAESLVKFDIAALAGKTVVSATLRLQTDIYGVGYVPRTWYVHALAASWSGTSVTWDNAPGQYYVASASNWNPPTAMNQTYNIDVTNTVRNWVGGTWPNNGFVFGLNDLSFPYMISFDAFEFYSSEDPGGRGPKLVVTYQ